MNIEVESAFRSKFDARPAILAAIVGLLVYAVTLAGGFAYDFYGVSVDDVRLRDPSQWGTYWTQAYNGGIDNLYRPLTSTFLAVESLIFGLDASDTWKFHLVSCLLHAACCALVAELARRLTNSRIAILTGLLFAVHPIHVEPLCDIVGQAELLCAIGVLGSLVLFLHRPMTTGRAIAIFGCFVLALLSKETGMLLPAILLTLGLLSPKPAGAEKPPMKLLAILLCFTLSAYLLIRENLLKLKFWWDRSFLDTVINPLILSHGKDRLLMPVVLLGHYLQLLIFPWKLSPDYGGEVFGSVAHLNDPYLYLGTIALIAWCALAIAAFRRRKNVMLLCLLCIAITYGLVGNIVVIIGTIFAERLMYLPSVFFLILCSIGLSRLPKQWMVGLTAILLLLGSIRAISYAHQWNDRMTLYETAIQNQPKAVRLNMLLATEQIDRGDNAAGIATLRKAQQIAPTYNELWVYSAKQAIRIGDFDSAQEFLNRSNALGPMLTTSFLSVKLADARAAAAAAKANTSATQPTTQQK